jgi:polyisoprenoid-binding protein YceI
MTTKTKKATTGATADTTVQVPPTGRYEIDPRASTVAFRARHLFGLAGVRGTVAVARGVIDVADPIGDSRVDADLDAGSFHTGGRHRDRDVRSARFLDAGRHPRITFASERLERTGDGWALAGTLTVRDVERPVRLTIRRCAVQPGSPGSLVVEATTRIDRTDFGITAARGMAGRRITLSLRVLAVRR